MSFVLSAVIGKPILHSLSPLLHRAGLKQCDIEGTYIRLAAASASEAIQVLREMEAQGCNVTSPFKEEAFKLASQTDDASARLRAANTLVLTAEGIAAFNTDVAGVQRTVLECFPRRERQKAVVLGTGGAARAALLALRELEWEVIVVGRSPERLREIAQLVPCQSCSFAQLPQALLEATLLISCVTGDELLVPAELLSPRLTVFDAVYGRETKLWQAAQEGGATILRGEQWLLYQGCEAFEHLTGHAIDADALGNALNTLPGNRTQFISLIGCMGSGKTTVAKLVAAELGLPFLDLDEEITIHEGRSISDIFNAKGESYFRDCESRLLQSLGAPAVVACGGGVVLRETNRDILEANSLNIWLWASAEALTKRLNNATDRPLLQNKPVLQTVRQNLAARFPFYAQLSDLVVPTGDKTPEDVAKRICYEICASGKY